MEFAQCRTHLLQALMRARKIKDVDATLDAVEVRRHAGIPFLLAVTDVAGGCEEFFFGGDGDHGVWVRIRVRIRIRVRVRVPAFAPLGATVGRRVRIRRSWREA